MDMECSICSQPGECIQSPNETFPNIHNTANQVTCGQVERFALFSNSLTLQECDQLKSNANSGICGGCGTSNCISQKGVSYAASPVPTPSPSAFPSSIPSSAPVKTFPTSFPTLRPTLAVPPGAIPSIIPSSAPAKSFPTSSPTLRPTMAVSNASSTDSPSAVHSTDSSLMDTACSICTQPGECIQSPDEMYPDVNNTAIQVTCRQVEQFALFSNSATHQDCDLLKSHANDGACGGCGIFNCNALDNVSYAAPQVPIQLPSVVVPSRIPSSIPTTSLPSIGPSRTPSSIPATSFPTSFPTFLPTTAEPSTPPTGAQSAMPTIKGHVQTSPISSDTRPVSEFYVMPREWTEDTEVLVLCSLCHGGCAQMPDELFPNMEEGMEVSCRAVEEFVFTSGISRSYCTLLKTYLFLGSCGGCGTNNCS
jgi:hypothetical protein